MKKRKQESPFKFPSAEECPSFFDHTPSPSGYLDWHAWAKKMGKTHHQVRCTRCGFLGDLGASPKSAVSEQSKMTTHHELLQVTVTQDRNVMRSIDARSPYVFRGKRNFRSRFLRDVIEDHRVETVEVGNLAKVDLLRCPHALGKCGLFENVEMTMQHFMAFYEDAARTEAAARQEGFDGENGSLMDFVEPSDYCTAKTFPTLADAESWLKQEIGSHKTVFGAGTIRMQEKVARRCRYCTCRGTRNLHEYTVEDSGIVEDEAIEDDCLN